MPRAHSIGSSLIAEIAGPRQVEYFGAQFKRPAVEAADVAGTLNEVARLTRAQLTVLRPVTLKELLDRLGSDTCPLTLGILLEDLGVLFRGRRSQIDAIAH